MARRRPPSWVLAGVPIAAAVVLAAAISGSFDAGGDSSVTPDRAMAAGGLRAGEPAASAPGGGDGAAEGFARAREGAAAAALAYLAVLPSLVAAEPTEREAVLAELTAPGSANVFTETLEGLALLDRTLLEARAALPGARVLVREVPVSYTVAAYDDQRARVEVWSLGVVLIEGRTDATEVWSTNTVELTWAEGTWRVWAWSRRPGPVPAPSTDSPTPPAAVLAGVGSWEALRYAPAS